MDESFPFVCDVFLCFVTFPCVVLGQVWYLIVSIPDLCNLTFIYTLFQFSTIFQIHQNNVFSIIVKIIQHLLSFESIAYIKQIPKINMKHVFAF